MTNCPRIVITPGDPSGIGPDIVVKAAQRAWPAELIVIGDIQLLKDRAENLNLPLELYRVDFNTQPAHHKKGALKFLPLTLNEPAKPGLLNHANANYILKSLELATDCCLENKANAMVTGPVNKSIINKAGIAFTGHTEFLAERCHANDVIMFFVAPQLKVSLLTTHIPLARVPSALTIEKIQRHIKLLHSELVSRFHISHPKILVCGLNPHAGEQGYLGREEIEIIEPALASLPSYIKVKGPLPADTIFTEKYLNEADAILAMYHDQALPVVKYLGFGQAVNVTLGLPIIRTSVDHGTAIDKAGTHEADAGSLESAIKLAIELSTSMS